MCRLGFCVCLPHSLLWSVYRATSTFTPRVRLLGLFPLSRGNCDEDGDNEEPASGFFTVCCWILRSNFTHWILNACDTLEVLFAIMFRLFTASKLALCSSSCHVHVDALKQFLNYENKFESDFTECIRGVSEACNKINSKIFQECYYCVFR